MGDTEKGTELGVIAGSLAPAAQKPPFANPAAFVPHGSAAVNICRREGTLSSNATQRRQGGLAMGQLISLAPH